jgi:acetyl-CoA carboxylase beta subunit
MSILDIALIEQRIKDCKESMKILEEIKTEEESLNLQEKCPYCNDPFYRLDFEEHIRKCHNHETYYKQTTIFGSLSTVQVNCIKFMHENSHKQHFSAKLPLQRRMEKMGYKA